MQGRGPEVITPGIPMAKSRQSLTPTVRFKGMWGASLTLAPSSAKMGLSAPCPLPVVREDVSRGFCPQSFPLPGALQWGHPGRSSLGTQPAPFTATLLLELGQALRNL